MSNATKSTEEVKVSEPVSCLKAIIDLNTKEVSVDKIHSMIGMTKFTRAELIGALRELQSNKKGALIVGRHGHKSRFLWDGITPEKSEKKTYAKKVSIQTQAQQFLIGLKIQIGNVSQVLPLKLDVVSLAA